MKNLMLALLTAIFIFSTGNSLNAQNMNGENFENSIFEKGVKGPSEWFTGTVWVKTLMAPGENLHYTIGDVKFGPGARTLWHTHPIEQVLLITNGNGFYQEKGCPARPLSKGDTVVIPPGVEHWHGAAPESTFTHIAITNYKDNSNVTWLQAVTDEEYRNATAK